MTINTIVALPGADAQKEERAFDALVVAALWQFPLEDQYPADSADSVMLSEEDQRALSAVGDDLGKIVAGVVADNPFDSLDVPPPVEVSDYPSFPLIPGYKILHEVGRGGMGVVYKAFDYQTGRAVAIKTIRDTLNSTPEIRARFRREMVAIARVRHPNVAVSYAFGTERDVLFLVMEFLSGGSLKDRVRNGPLEWWQAVDLMISVTMGLEAIHAHYILHRDLKPTNILFDEVGTPKIIDFGISRSLDAGESNLTRDGDVIGTPAYMSPEQVEGDLRNISVATDVYGLGAVLYECLTGRQPFVSPSGESLREQIRGRDPVPPSRLVPGLPRDLEVICLKCLRKEPASRYESAAALAEDLTRFLEGRPIRARPASPARRATLWARRNPAQATCALLLMMLGALLYTTASYAMALRRMHLPPSGERLAAEWNIQDPSALAARVKELRSRLTDTEGVPPGVVRLRESAETRAATDELRHSLESLECGPAWPNECQLTKVEKTLLYLRSVFGKLLDDDEAAENWSSQERVEACIFIGQVEQAVLCARSAKIRAAQDGASL